MVQVLWKTALRLPSEGPLPSPGGRGRAGAGARKGAFGAGPQHTTLRRLWPIRQSGEAVVTLRGPQLFQQPHLQPSGELRTRRVPRWFKATFIPLPPGRGVLEKYRISALDPIPGSVTLALSDLGQLT